MIRPAADEFPDATLAAEIEPRALDLTDELTGLLTADAFGFLGEYQARLAQRTGRSFALLYVAIDGLEAIAEHFGPEGVQRALRETAELLRGSFRAADVCARLGADDFCVLLSDVHRSRVGPEIACLRLLDRLEELNADGGMPFRIELLTGVASSGPDRDAEFGELIARARAQAFRSLRAP